MGKKLLDFESGKSLISLELAYYAMAVRCVDEGFLLLGTGKSGDVPGSYYRRAQKALDCGSLRTVVGLTSARGTKLQVHSAGFPQSPLALRKDSRKRQSLARVKAELAKRYAKLNYKTAYGYHMVLTVPNCGIGSLNSVLDDLTRIRKDLLHWFFRKNSLKTKILGVDASIELTVNEDGDGKGLYHPHLHLVLLTDKKFDTKPTFLNSDNFLKQDTVIGEDWSVILSWWADKVKKYGKISTLAQKLEEVYSKEDDADGLVDALVEAEKYTAKAVEYTPDSVEEAEEASEQQLEVFAEVYGALKHRKTHTSGGVFYEVSTLIRKLESKKMLSPFVHAFSVGFSDAIGEFSILSAESDDSWSRELDDEELLFFNRCAFERIGFDFDLASLKLDDACGKGNRALKVLQSIEADGLLVRPTVESVEEKLEKELIEDNRKFSKIKVKVMTSKVDSELKNKFEFLKKSKKFKNLLLNSFVDLELKDTAKGFTVKNCDITLRALDVVAKTADTVAFVDLERVDQHLEFLTDLLLPRGAKGVLRKARRAELNHRLGELYNLAVEKSKKVDETQGVFGVLEILTKCSDFMEKAENLAKLTYLKPQKEVVKIQFSVSSSEREDLLELLGAIK